MVISELNDLLSDMEVSDSGKDKVLDYIGDSLSAFSYAGVPYDKSKFYIVSRHSGDVVVFRVLNNTLVEDRLDRGYVDSMSLKGLEEWDIKGVWEVSFNYLNNIFVEKIEYKKVHTYSASVVKANRAKYVMACEGFSFPYSVLVDMEAYSTLDYPSLLDCMRVTYNRFVRRDGITTIPSCYLVSFE